MKVNFQNGARIISQVLNWFQSALSGNATNRINDYSQAGICKGLLSEFNIVPNVGLNPLAIDVNSGVAYDINGARIFISSTDTTPYNTSNPTTTTNDGLGNFVLTPQSTGCINIVLTPSVANYIWIQYLSTTDVTAFTLHKITRGKLFYKQTDGYNIVVNTTGIPPDGSGTWSLLGHVMAPASGVIAPSAIFQTGRIYSADLPYRTLAQTALASKADATITYTPGTDIFVDDHIKSLGTGVPSATNPHGLTATDIGINPTAIVQNHQEYFHTNGIRGNPLSTSSSFFTIVSTSAFSADSLNVYGLSNTNVAPGIPGEEALLNGVTLSNATFPSSTQVLFFGPVTDTTANVFTSITAITDGTHIVVTSTAGMNPTDTLVQGSFSTTISSVTDGTHLVVANSTGFKVSDLTGTWYIYVDSSLTIKRTQTNILATPVATQLLLYSVVLTFGGPPGYGTLSSLTDHRVFGTISQYDLQANVPVSKLAPLSGSTNDVITRDSNGFIQASSILSTNIFLANGTVPATGNLDFGGHKGVNGATPTNPTDLVIKSYVDGLTGGMTIQQIVQGTDNSSVSTTSTSLVNTNVLATITPSSTSSKIIVVGSIIGWFTGDVTGGVIFAPTRGGTTLYETRCGAQNGSVNSYDTVTLFWVDSPSTTSATTYHIKFASQDGATVNAGFSGLNCFIYLIEILQG